VHARVPARTPSAAVVVHVRAAHRHGYPLPP